MPGQPAFDIANADQWFGFRPGMTRPQTLEQIRKLGLQEAEYDDDYFSMAIGGVELEFWFQAGDPARLRQISADGGEIFWNNRPLLETRVDGALRTLEPLGRAPMWEANDATSEPFPEAVNAPAGAISDEALLEEGTIWLPERGLGLVVYDGEIAAVAWREVRDLPAQFAGPVTDAQRQLSKRPDIETYLREKRAARQRVNVPKTPFALLHGILVWVCLGLLAVVGWQGFQEMRRWNQAPTLTGKFLSMKEVPKKKFFDLGPERLRALMPDDPNQHRELFRIEYLDPSGHQQGATLEAAEFYVPPREPGEDVPIAYVAGEPPQVKGLSRAANAAFVEYMPWAIAVGIFYVIAQMSIGFLPGLLRLAGKAIVPPGGNVDHDRPELR
jgi:hypothetical protein